MSRPYIDLGLTVLLAKERENPDLFALFEPFEWKLWLAVGCATCFCGIAPSICSFCSPFGYRGRYLQRRKRHDMRFYGNRGALNFHNGVWLSISSLMGQVCLFSILIVCNTVTMFWIIWDAEGCILTVLGAWLGLAVWQIPLRQGSSIVMNGPKQIEINLSNFYSANIPSEARFSGASAELMFNSTIDETVP